MQINDPAWPVIDGLILLQIPFLLTGSHASNYYGIPRSSQDTDLLVDLGQRSIADIEQRLPIGYRLDRQVEFETMTGTLKNVIHVAGTEHTIELFRLGNDAFHQERFRRRVKLLLCGREIWLPTVEDVIIQKLRWGRSKDLDDVRDVLSVQGDACDWNYIHHWCALHNTRGKLDELRKSLPRFD